MTVLSRSDEEQEVGTLTSVKFRGEFLEAYRAVLGRLGTAPLDAGGLWVAAWDALGGAP